MNWLLVFLLVASVISFIVFAVPAFFVFPEKFIGKYKWIGKFWIRPRMDYLNDLQHKMQSNDTSLPKHTDYDYQTVWETIEKEKKQLLQYKVDENTRALKEFSKK
jgi:hypothetical protein